MAVTLNKTLYLDILEYCGDHVSAQKWVDFHLRSQLDYEKGLAASNVDIDQEVESTKIAKGSTP